MATHVVPDHLLQQAVETMAHCGGNQTIAAAELGISRAGLQGRLQMAARRGIAAGQPPIDSPAAPAVPPRDVEVATLRKQLRDAQAGAAIHEWAKSIITAADEQARQRPPARWLREHITTPSAPGIPTLLLSDLHWGEVVRSEELGFANDYDMPEARRRLQVVTEKTAALLRDHVVGDYPGIVVCLGGDLVSGSIHDELQQTNDGTVLQQMLDLFEHLQASIRFLADEFGRVHLPCVTGNHGRSNIKWQAKRRGHLSYEWLLYQFLQRAFAGDERITWQIPDGPDADYDLLGTRYRLTHGDAFRSSDSVIGPVGPITRGTLKRSRMASSMGQPFDHLLMGHWHTLIWGANFIVNSSLKGYDEYAMSLSVAPEPASQALWLTSEKHGRTIQMPVYA